MNYFSIFGLRLNHSRLLLELDSVRLDALLVVTCKIFCPDVELKPFWEERTTTNCKSTAMIIFIEAFDKDSNISTTDLNLRFISPGVLILNFELQFFI